MTTRSKSKTRGKNKSANSAEKVGHATKPRGPGKGGRKETPDPRDKEDRHAVTEPKQKKKNTLNQFFIPPGKDSDVNMTDANSNHTEGDFMDHEEVDPSAVPLPPDDRSGNMDIDDTDAMAEKDHDLDAAMLRLENNVKTPKAKTGDVDGNNDSVDGSHHDGEREDDLDMEKDATQDKEDATGTDEFEFVATHPPNTILTEYEKSFDFLTRDSDDTSMGDESDTTRKDGNAPATAPVGRKLVRLFVHTWLFRDVPANVKFEKRFSSDFNTFMEIFREKERGAKLMPWALTDPKVSRGGITNISNDESMYLKYFWNGAKYNSLGNNPGQKWFRINLSVSEACDLEEVFYHMEHLTGKNWWIPDKKFCNYHPCQAVQPQRICWFLRSFEEAVICDDLQRVLREKCEDQTLGLEWREISRESKKSSSRRRSKMDSKGPKIYAVHVEVEGVRVRRNLRRIETTYRNRDAPLGWNWRPVRTADMQGMTAPDKRDGIAKCSFHQHKFEEMIGYAEVVVKNMDKYLPKPYSDRTLRRLLMELRVKRIEGCIGDPLFFAIYTLDKEEHRYGIAYQMIVGNEAHDVAENLYLLMKYQLLLTDLSDYFDMDEIMSKREWKWDARNQKSIDPAGDYFENILGKGDVFEDDEEYQAHMGGYQHESPLLNVPELHAVLYQRGAGNCEETIVDRNDRTSDRVKTFTSTDGKHKEVPTAVNTGQDEEKSAGDMSGLTKDNTHGERTTESKAQRYADEREEEVTKEFENIFSQQRRDHASEKAALEATNAELKQQMMLMMQQQNEMAAAISTLRSGTTDGNNNSSSATHQITPTAKRSELLEVPLDGSGSDPRNGATTG